MKRNLWIAICLLIFGVNLSGSEFNFENGFGEESYDKRHARLNDTEPLSGKQSLEINTLTGAGEWNMGWCLPAGVLQPGRSYQISLNARVIERQTDQPSYLLFLIRPLSSAHPLNDAGYAEQHSVGTTEQVKFRVNIPKQPTDYSLQIHTHFGVRALVDDITVAPIEDILLTADGGEPVPLPANLPIGAEDFTVDPPDRNMKVFHAKDFGVSPDSTNNWEALHNCIQTVRRQVPAKLVIEPGTYHLSGKEPILFDSIRNFEFDGQGAKLVFQHQTGSGQLMAVHNCVNVEFRNFSIDWNWDADPLASLVRVESVSEDGKTVKLRFTEYDKFPRRDLRAACLTRFDSELGMSDVVRPLNIYLEFSKGQNKPQVSLPEDNLLEITTEGNAFNPVGVGELFLLRHYAYDMAGLLLWSNSHMTLDNVHINSAPGMGIVVGDAQHHWQFLNCSVAPPKDVPRRPVSTTVDGIHFGSSAGYFRMENCELAYMVDDAMNFHDLNGFAVRLDDNRLLATNLNSHSGDYYREKDRVELLNDDFSPTGFTGTIKNIKHTIKPGHTEITFEETLPQMTRNGFLLLNRRFGTKHVILRNNYIHHFPRGLLLAAENVTIENNRFEYGSAAGIKLETGYTFNLWSEGYGVNNVVIRNNIFKSVNPSGCYPNENRPDIYINSYMRTDPSLIKSSYPILSRIWIADNTFSESTGSPVYVCTAADVTISGNKFINTREVPVKEVARAAIGISNSKNIRVLNNLWQSSDPAMLSGVLYDPSTTSDVQAAGNRLEIIP